MMRVVNSEDQFQRQLNRPRPAEAVEGVIAPARRYASGSEAGIDHAVRLAEVRKKKEILRRGEAGMIKGIEDIPVEPQTQVLAKGEVAMNVQIELLERKSAQQIASRIALRRP